MAQNEAVKITVSETRMRSGMASGSPNYTKYLECNGPDGQYFTNSSLVTLRRVLKSRYGPVSLTVVQD